MTFDTSRTANHPRVRARVVVLAGVWIAALACVLGGFVEALPSGFANAAFVAVTVPLVGSTVTVGAVLVGRLPRNILGWLLLSGGVTLAISTASGALADSGLNQHPGSVPGAIWFAIVSGATGGTFIGLLGGYVPLFFPTGRLPSARWRAVVLMAMVPTFSPVITNLFGPFSAGTYPASVSNPLELGGFGGSLVGLLSVVSSVLGLVALVCVVTSLVVRYRRAQGVERAQLKWFAYVGLVVVPTLLVAIVASSATSGPLGVVTGAISGPLAVLTSVAWATAIGGLTLLPITIGIAVLRYRLYEIDRLVSRTISWTLMTVLIASLFVGGVLALQELLAPILRTNELAVAGSTLLVFALFQPIRRRVQRLVDRRFNRARYDAEATVAAFAGRLRVEVDLERLLAEIVVTVARTVEPSSVTLWLRE